MHDILLESLQRFLADTCPPAQIRRFEHGESTADVWSQIAEFGYADALRSEDNGGAGLSLQDVRAMIVLLGRMAAPVPLADTMIARALLENAGASFPAGPIVLMSPVQSGGQWAQGAVPLALKAEFALAELGGKLVLTPLAEAQVTATGVQSSLAADIAWKTTPKTLAEAPCATASLREISATLRAAQMAGAMSQLLDMTVDYANTRKQFGKALAQFQAIQQQLAQMAEFVLAGNMAVQLAFASPGIVPQPLLAALAKQNTSAAAARVSSIAHAVHGAIGLSEEFDLQLYTRRLSEWRLADGSEAYWSKKLGAARLSSEGNTVNFIRDSLTPKEIAL